MKRYTDQERQNHVTAWETSGLSRSAYARGEGLHQTTFCKWAAHARQKRRGFVELPQGAAYQGSGEITITRGDIQIRLPAEMLERVLGTVLGISGGTI